MKKEIFSKINTCIENNGHLVNFFALIIAIAALVIAIIAIITIPTIINIPKSVVDFCPSIIVSGGGCDDIRNTCGEEKKNFNISCEKEGDFLKFISNIYNKGGVLATNIEMYILFENDTLLTKDGLTMGMVSIYENGKTREQVLVCKNTQNICFIKTIIPVLKFNDNYEFNILLKKRDFKQPPKFIKFILYQDGEIRGEKNINISYKQGINDFSNPRMPQPVDGIVTYRSMAANNATVSVRNMRTEEVMTTTTNELGQYIVELANMKSDTYYEDFILVKACFEHICSAEKEIKADTVLGANDDVNINIE